jgi:hypothetical protein
MKGGFVGVLNAKAVGFLVISLSLLLNPSTTPDESVSLAQNQLNNSLSSRRSVLANDCIGSHGYAMRPEFDPHKRDTCKSKVVSLGGGRIRNVSAIPGHNGFRAMKRSDVQPAPCLILAGDRF